LALPFLDSLCTPAQAQAAVEQKNLVLFFKPHGSYLDDYFPLNPYTAAPNFGAKDLGSGFRELPFANITGPLSKILASDFDAIRSAINIYWGIGSSSENHNPSIAFATNARYPSIDQLAARSPIFNKGRKRVMVWRATQGFDNASSFELTGSGVQGVNPQSDAVLAFSLLFGNMMPTNTGSSAPTENTAYLRKLTSERKALDAVLEDYKRLQNSSVLSAADKKILQNYMDFVAQKQAEISKMMGAGTTPGGAVAIPNKPNPSVNASPLTLVDTLIELLVAAIQTNTCNIFNFQLAATVDETVFELPVNGYNRGGFHGEISHNPGRRNDHTQVDRHLFSKVAKAYKMLNTAMGGAGAQTYADNTLIYVGGDIGTGEVPNNHKSSNLISMSLSGKNIPIKTGRCLAASPDFLNRAYPNNQVLIGMMEAVGVKDWKSVLLSNGINSPGFGDYRGSGAGGNLMPISDADKDKAMPFLMV
jgi:hypothetical protein